MVPILLGTGKKFLFLSYQDHIAYFTFSFLGAQKEPHGSETAWL